MKTDYEQEAREWLEVNGINIRILAPPLARKFEEIAERAATPRCKFCGSTELIHACRAPEQVEEFGATGGIPPRPEWKAGCIVVNRKWNTFIYRLKDKTASGLWTCEQWNWVSLRFEDCGDVATGFTVMDYEPWPRVGDWVRCPGSVVIFPVAKIDGDRAWRFDDMGHFWYPISELEPATPPSDSPKLEGPHWEEMILNYLRNPLRGDNYALCIADLLSAVLELQKQINRVSNVDAEKVKHGGN